MSLVIYKASAGSGKTYTLAKEYLRLALRSEDYYKKILAVTFTNRAAEEMKERVLDFLKQLSGGSHELLPILAEDLGLSPVQLQSRADGVLRHLLHHYSYFNITTIDTFFHKVIRAFSREIGLQGSFGIELDTEKVAEYITTNVYQGAEANKQLRSWLVEFAMSKLFDGKGYEFKSEVTTLAKQLFSEEFKKLPHEQFQDEKFKEAVGQLKASLIQTKSQYEKALEDIATSFFQTLEDAGLQLEDLAGGKTRSVGNFFKKLTTKQYDTLVNTTVQKARDDAGTWSSKTSSKRALILQQAEAHFMPLMNEALMYIDTNGNDYYTARAVLRHLYTLGLMADLAQRLQDYKKEEELIMISDLPDFLSQIIDDTGSPFIYEKVGARYAHFLIDEFQDTSAMQWGNFKPLLEESLAQGHENIIVGDAKQSIYGWRGGDPSILLQQVKRDLPQTYSDESKSINWRSARQVVEFNNGLFSRLPGLMCDLMDEVIVSKDRAAIEATYETAIQEVAPKNTDIEGQVQVAFLEVEKGERWLDVAFDRTLDTIEDLLAKGHALNDMAILVRSNSEAAYIVQRVLEYRRETSSRVEVISAEGMLLAKSSAVQMMLTAFQHLLYPDDGAIRADLVFRYQQYGKGKAFQRHEDFLKLTKGGGLPTAFERYKQHLLHLPILELVEVLIRTFELDAFSQEYAYLQAFQDAVLEYTKNHRSDIRLFLEWWEEEGSKRSVQLTGALNAIEVITSHKAKGLQYPIVFVPFCHYKFDSKSHPSWYARPTDASGLEALQSIPVDYKAELEKTHFAASYAQEHAKWHLESLNVLYVAFTRAERGLFVFCDAKSGDPSSVTASKLLRAYFEKYQPEGWVQSASYFSKGDLQLGKEKKAEPLLALKGYVSNKWSNKLSIRKMGKSYYDDEVEKQRNEGILLHDILSEIIRWESFEEVLDRYEKRMDITLEDKRRYHTILTNLWQNDQVKSWFDGQGTVKTEVVVLPKHGETKRMDRVILKGETAIVIDFKSGEEKTGDKHQVSEYIKLLREMGYRVEGFLLYLKSATVVAV